jgi:hypothetical protein
MAKKQDTLTSFKPQDYSGFVQSTLALEKAKAKAQDPTASFAAFATPILTELDRQAGVVAEAKETFLENMPDDFQVEFISPELRGQLTEKLKDYKAEYLEGVELLSKHANNPNSIEYKQGVEITEGAKNKMMNTYNGLAKLQQDRAFEINNASNRGYNETANTALADQLIVGLNSTQVTYDENGNPIYNSGLEGVDPINVNDYKRTTTFDKNSLDSINTLFVTQPYNLGAKGESKKQFDIINRGYATSISGNKQLADQLFFIGVYGDNNGETAVLKHIEKINSDGKADNDLIPLEKDANGKVIPPSKSENNMNALKDYLTVMGEDAFKRGSEKGGTNPNTRDTTFVSGQYITNKELEANVETAKSLIKSPGRSNAIPIAGLPRLGTVWYDENKKVYVYEDPDSSGLQEDEAGYKRREYKDVEQLLTLKSGGALKKFFKKDYSQFKNQ